MAAGRLKHEAVWPPQDGLLSEAFLRLLQDGSWASYNGPNTDSLRSLLQRMHGVSHSVLCCSGTAAMELALRGCRAGASAGDEVILSAYDFKSNFINVLLAGARPVLVDTLPNKPVPDPEQVRSAISERTRAIIVSHLHGFFAEVTAIREFAAEHSIPVIEDACQAIGGLIEGRRAGSLGDVAITSFGGSKLVTSGRGGAVLTSSAAIAQRIQLWQQRGNEAYPLSEMQAAILLPQLQMLDARTVIRFAGADRLTGKWPTDELLTPAIPEQMQADPRHRDPGFLPAFYKLAFLSRGSIAANGRERLELQFRKHGIRLSPAFPALHMVHAQSRWTAPFRLAHAETLSQRLMTLHHTHLLRSPEEIDELQSTIFAVLRQFEADGRDV